MAFFNKNLNQQKPVSLNGGKLKLISLGGTEVNRNMHVYETEKDIIIVDCGIGFPDETMPGIDVVIPDITYLADKKNKIRAVFLTHGHQDHWGSLPYILPELPKVPVYGTKLTIGLAATKTKESGMNVDFRQAQYKSPIQAGEFSVEYIHLNHSVPDTAQLVIRTPTGTVYHGSDFKFDWTPVEGEPADVQRIAQVGAEGVLLMLEDCLRVEKPGYTPTEKIVEETFEQQIQKCQGKFIVTTTASSITRVQQAVNVALRHKRKICFVGRSMEQNAEVSAKLGFLTFPQNQVIKIEDVKRFSPKEIVIIVTGALGQDNSALARMANGEHKIKINEGDFVTFSQDPIPGSETAVDGLINSLIKTGAEVFYSSILDDLHVSGHESADGLKLLINLVKPKYLMPIGGDLRQVKRYRKMVKTMGYGDDMVITPNEGDIVEVSAGKVKINGRAEVKNILVDGLGIGDVGNVVLRDRLTMSEDGVVMVVVPIEKSTGEIVGDIDIISRGFVYMKESDELISEAKLVVKETMEQSMNKQNVDFRYVRRRITEQLENYLFEATHRQPLVLPMIVEV